MWQRGMYSLVSSCSVSLYKYLYIIRKRRAKVNNANQPTFWNTHRTVMKNPLIILLLMTGSRTQLTCTQLSDLPISCNNITALAGQRYRDYNRNTGVSHRQVGQSRWLPLYGRLGWSQGVRRILCIHRCSHYWHSAWPRCCRDSSSSRSLTKGQGRRCRVSTPGRWCRSPRWKPRRRGWGRGSGRRGREEGERLPDWEL